MSVHLPLIWQRCLRRCAPCHRQHHHCTAHQVTRLPSIWAHLSDSCFGLLCIAPQAVTVLLLWQGACSQLLAGAADSPQARAAGGCDIWPPFPFLLYFHVCRTC